jgi:transcriptional regulator with XRE-family HTH domain
MKKSSPGSKIIAADVDWPAELRQTLEETGWTKTQLADYLGLYVQRTTNSGGSVSPHLYAWLRGQHKPKLYLLYALRYARLMHGKEPAITLVCNSATEPVDEP